MSNEAKANSQVAKPGSRAPSGRKRKQISDPSSSFSDTDSASPSSVEYPVEGKLPGTENDLDG